MSELGDIKKKVMEGIKSVTGLRDLDALEIEYIGRSGALTAILRSLKDRTEEDRRRFGRAANDLKIELEELIQKKRGELERAFLHQSLKKDRIDMTQPGRRPKIGGLHPLSLALRDIDAIFSRMGFTIAEGPEMENEWYNFDSLNMPADHSARDMWDTFWIKGKKPKTKDFEKLLMRTHTSPVQARFMEKHTPPFKIISPGRTFRYEATDASHDFQFWQVEGLVVGKEVNVAHFKYTTKTFFSEFFKTSVDIRLRPSFFPFTEPSFEVDVKRKGGKWLEVMGAGMVHPTVLRNAGIDPNQWQGFAFGGGLDRFAMLKYNIPDIRLFRENNLKFLKQFSKK
jgi:phenylalanyl-tRNA synthetase alpha chain